MKKYRPMTNPEEYRDEFVPKRNKRQRIEHQIDKLARRRREKRM